MSVALLLPLENTLRGYVLSTHSAFLFTDIFILSYDHNGCLCYNADKPDIKILIIVIIHGTSKTVFKMAKSYTKLHYLRN